MRGRIVDARQNAATCVHTVSTLLGNLRQRAEASRRRLDTIASERNDLLTT